MNINELIDLIVKTLPDYLDKPGESLYSAASTLSKGDIYLLGTNPGGEKPDTLSEDLENLRTKKNNEYIDGVWSTKSNPNPNPGEDTLQLKVKELMAGIDYSVEDVCASNLIFYTSVDVVALKKEFAMSFNKIAEKYWDIHMEILKVVQPKVIIVFGHSETDSPYSFLRKKYKNLISSTDTQTTGWGDNIAKSFKFDLNGRKCHVVGVPHLSRFAIKNPEVYTWIKKKIKD